MSRPTDRLDATGRSCKVWGLYSVLVASAILYIGGIYFLASRSRVNLPLIAFWSIFFPAMRWIGSRARRKSDEVIDDQLAASLKTAPVEVTYYTLTGCPFCPIVEERLKTLQKQMDFSLRKVDLTFKPQTAAEKGIRSVPVVEVGSDRVVGNASMEQLAALIGRA